MRFKERLVRGVGYLVKSSERGLKFVEETGGGHCFAGVSCEEAITKYKARHGEKYSPDAILWFMAQARGQHYVTDADGVLIQRLDEPSAYAVVELLVHHRRITYRVLFADGTSFGLPLRMKDIEDPPQDQSAVE
jgi:hypothetical protein